MKRRIRVGKEFQLEAEAIRADADRNESRTRSFVAGAILLFGSIAAGVTFYVGFRDGSFNELQGFWIGYGPIIGGLAGYYFGQKNAEN